MCLAKHQNKGTTERDMQVNVSHLNCNISCFLCFQVRNDKCVLACTVCLVWFAANKSKVSKNWCKFKSIINPKNNIGPILTALFPQAFLLHGWRPVCLLEEHGTISDAKSSWQMKFSTPLPGEPNQISSIWRCRIKTKATRGRVCMAGIETRNWCISNTF